MNEHEHDLVVVGAGPGGYVAAIRAAQLGMNVACIDEHAQLGGTCLRVGCIPSKALLESSDKYLEAREKFEQHGIQLEGISLDLAAMMQRKERIVKTLCQGVEHLFKKNKIKRYRGRGRLDGPGRVIVALAGDEEETLLKSRHVIIATGSRPASIPGIELDGDRIGTSTEALSYREVPEQLVVIGAGYIGLEMGSVWNRLGAKVTVLEALDRILPGTDDEIAAQAQKLFAKQGLDFRLETKVTSAKVQDEQVVVQCEGTDDLTCDRLLVAVGRIPNTEDLGLDSVDVELDDRGQIPVNESFATVAEGIYGIGDCIGGPLLAHKASDEGIACVEAIVSGHSSVNYAAIPSVVYTDPEIAAVGKTEAELTEAGQAYRKGSFPFRASGRARTLGSVEGLVKVLADEETDRLLGVHILGPRAGDLIAEAATAISVGASAEDLAMIPHAHPTLAEALREAALDADKRAIHVG